MHWFSLIKKVLPICLCILLTEAKINAQDVSKIPEYKKELTTSTTDTAKARIYAMLGFHNIQANTDTALMYGNKALILARKTNSNRAFGDSYNTIGWAYFQKRDFTKSEQYLQASFDAFKKTGNKYFMRIPLSNLGNLYMDKTEYSKSLQCFMQALQYDAELHDKRSEAQILYSIGRLYNMQNKPAEARKYFQQAYTAQKQLGNETLMAEAIMSIGNTYQYENKLSEALKHYQQSLVYFKKFGDDYRTGILYENFAGVYLKQKNYQTAINNFNLAIEHYKKVNDTEDIVYAISGIGDVYFAMKDYDNALASYKKALAYNNNKKLEQQIKQTLSDTYKNQEDYKNAYEFLISSNAIKDSLFTQAKQDELVKLQTQFETARKEKENQLLKAQNIAAEAKLRQNRLFLAAAIIGILLLAALLYAVHKNRQAKIKNIETLHHLNQQLETQKEEITRINTLLELKALRAQMNPHFIFNCMSSIQECILTNRVDDANTYLSKLSKLLRLVLIHSDDESITLSKEIEILRLYLELESVRLKGGFDYTLNIEEELPVNELMMPALLLQPFAENAIWHGLLNKSGERRLTIDMQVKNETLCCIIEDNGIGRAQAALLKGKQNNHTGKGISMIEKRLHIIQKYFTHQKTGYKIHDLHNEFNQPAGTRVEVFLPLIFSMK